jgi:ferredoxin
MNDGKEKYIMKKLVVDSGLCMDFRICEALAGQLFKVNDLGYAEVLKQPETEEEIALAEKAIKKCPKEAIMWEEE